MNLDRFDVIIIGGGAAGLFLASQLPSTITVAVIECGERVGKKLLATGNGKCNLTNLDITPDRYNEPNIVENFLNRFSAKDAVAAFEKMGLITKSIDGRVYPYSECASSVLDVLRRACDRDGVRIFTSHFVNSIEKKDGLFCVSGTPGHVDKSGNSDKSDRLGKASRFDKSNEKFRFAADNVVLATGSPATFGKDSTSLYAALGHSVRQMTPSLVPIKTDKASIKGLQGVRVKAGVRLGERYEVGEVLFKEFGVSGIAAFNISGELARGRAHVGDTLTVDFMPEYSLKDVENLLRAHDNNSTVAELLIGTFHSRVQDRLMCVAGCEPMDKAANKISALANAIKSYKLTVEGLGDNSLAQVMSGGLNVREFDENLMSAKVSGAYAIGEALDIDGECGGYNLQWAWSSANAVAASIARNVGIKSQIDTVSQ
ncbi:MAG: NAD(P)/FAD-dependent oxidoreductase [Clostridia bacterium]|nr:NAD(P)/FAD-dependent oxidoreductase [Clostridia bacterium]